MKKGRKLAESESYGKAQDTVRKYAAERTGSKGRAPPKNGGVKYNLTFDIAKASDGRTILYTTKGKIKKVGNAEVHSLKIRGAEQNSNFDESITDESENVKTYREPERLNELRRQNEELKQRECILTFKKSESRSKRYKACSDLVRPTGFEPTTFRVGV